MALINGDRIITAQLYDDEHEEFTEKKMSIIDFINAYSDEGVTTADDGLDKIRAEIVELTKCPYGTECLGANCPSNTDCMICGDHVLEIIDKYKAESEPQESEDKE